MPRTRGRPPSQPSEASNIMRDRAHQSQLYRKYKSMSILRRLLSTYRRGAEPSASSIAFYGLAKGEDGTWTQTPEGKKMCMERDAAAYAALVAREGGGPVAEDAPSDPSDGEGSSDDDPRKTI